MESIRLEETDMQRNCNNSASQSRRTSRDVCQNREASGTAKRRHYRCCGSTKLCWWEPDMEDINDTVDFSQETTLHGLKYICQPQRHLTERCFWLVAFFISLVVAGILISEIWGNYFNSPVVVTFQPFETSIDEIPFPAITICNMNKVQRSKANAFMKTAMKNDTAFFTKEAQKNIFYMEHVCSASNSFSNKFNYSSGRGEIADELLDRVKIQDGDDEQKDVAAFLRKASQSCSDMLPLCSWHDEAINCTKLFRPIETDFGKCCTFNMVPQTLLSRYLTDTREDPKEIEEWSAWDYEKDGLLIKESENMSRTYPRRQHRAGKSSGLSVLLNPDLNEYFCTSSDSQGFRLVSHLPLDVPHAADFGVGIRPNSEVFMGIRPDLTIADPDIRSFKLEKRNCYFRGEFQLKYFNHYTSSNCIDECLANITYDDCQCVRYYMPRDDNRDICGAAKFQCAETTRRKMFKAGVKKHCGFCRPTCTELEYHSETTVTPMQKGINIWLDTRNRSARWATKNVSIVHIYFSIDSVYAKVRKELYGVTDLIANTGGLLGLTMGFSCLSLTELIYFYTLRAWCRRRRKQTMWNVLAWKLHQAWMKTKARSAGRRYAGADPQRALTSHPSVSSGNSNEARIESFQRD